MLWGPPVDPGPLVENSCIRAWLLCGWQVVTTVCSQILNQIQPGYSPQLHHLIPIRSLPVKNKNKMATAVMPNSRLSNGRPPTNGRRHVGCVQIYGWNMQFQFALWRKQRQKGFLIMPKEQNVHIRCIMCFLDIVIVNIRKLNASFLFLAEIREDILSQVQHLICFKLFIITTPLPLVLGHLLSEVGALKTWKRSLCWCRGKGGERKQRWRSFECYSWALEKPTSMKRGARKGWGKKPRRREGGKKGKGDMKKLLSLCLF